MLGSGGGTEPNGAPLSFLVGVANMGYTEVIVAVDPRVSGFDPNRDIIPDLRVGRSSL